MAWYDLDSTGALRSGPNGQGSSRSTLPEALSHGGTVALAHAVVEVDSGCGRATVAGSTDQHRKAESMNYS